jgi:hypothetical protein
VEETMKRAALGIFLLMLPAAARAQAARPFAELDCLDGSASQQHFSASDRDGRRTWLATWSGDGCSIEIRLEGDIRIAASGTEIESMSAGSLLEINSRRGDRLSRVTARPGAGGRPDYKFAADGRDQPADAAAREWFGRVLLEIERRTGFAAESRVNGLLQRGGAGAVLDEIGNLRSDYVRSLYFRKLAAARPLESAEQRRAFELAGRQISSAYELSRVIREIAARNRLADEEVVAALAASEPIKSDYERSRVIRDLAAERVLSPAAMKGALQSAARFHSDYELSRVLVTLAGRGLAEPELQGAYLRTATDMRSDYERARALLALIETGRLEAAELKALFDAVARMRSDHEAGRVLAAAARRFRIEGDALSAYVAAADRLHSDYERNRALGAAGQMLRPARPRR